jgi:hypothetical protein
LADLLPAALLLRVISRKFGTFSGVSAGYILKKCKVYLAFSIGDIGEI